MVVGITGGIGSGKSTVLKMFSKFENVAVYAADDQAKKLINSSEEIKKKIIAEFSSKAYLNNKLNRIFLADIVFKDKKKLAALNEIVHPLVHQHFKDFVTNNSNKQYVLYENAILFENGSDVLCDKIITVTASECLRIERVTRRDGITKEEVKARIKNQWSEVKKTIQSNYCVENINLQETVLIVSRIHQSLTCKLIT